MKNTVVSKADLARELDCPRSRVTQLTHAGMPVRSDGKLDRLTALRWIVFYTSGAGGGWWGSLRGKPSIYDRAQALLKRGDS